MSEIVQYTYVHQSMYMYVHNYVLTHALSDELS